MWIVRQQETRRSREGNTMASRRRVVSTMPKKYFPKACGCLTFIYINFKLSAHFNKFIYPLLSVHLSQRLKCTIVITRCPSSVRPSSVVNFSHFRLLLWNRWTEFNKTWQEARSQRPLPSFVFRADRKKQDGCPCLWLAETFSTSPLKRLNGIQRNLTGSKISTSSIKFVF